MEHSIFHGEHYHIRLAKEAHGLSISGGNFGEVQLMPSALFHLRLKHLPTGESIHLSSQEGWDQVKAVERPTWVEFSFSCEKYPNLIVFVKATAARDGLCWSGEVINDNTNLSVMELSYPTPIVTGEALNYFMPEHSGRVFEDATHQEFFREQRYPNGRIGMQYFAIYGQAGGIYVGIEDGKAANKRFTFRLTEGTCSAQVDLTGIGASLPANSFALYGECRWQYFSGDWYDAAMLYADFVQKKAEWLPEIDADGRPDTPSRFKNIPFFICDYIPNSPSQGDNKPMSLSAGSDIYSPDYWYQAPIQLQKELDVPVGYHVYNWHEIPFNIEYPHFLPAKKEFTDHLAELHAHNISVFPYINAVSWEMNDADAGHDVNFANTGYKEALVGEDGEFFHEPYPQITVSGKPSWLAQSCGSSAVWHKMMESLTRQMEDELDIDGIYFDQIACTSSKPCYNPAHSHLPGGGTYWVEGYNRLMKAINRNKPDDAFYFSESVAEPYMKNFDGYLTWMWVHANEVPAYSAVYGGYIELLGRNTMGLKKDDFEFFKYCTARSLLSGQILGWCKADLVYSEERLAFLKKMVAARNQYNHLFHCARMLRPPKVTCDLEKLVTAPGMQYDGTIVSDVVLAGAWQYRDGSKTVIFAINIAEQEANYTLTIPTGEYLPTGQTLPADFSSCGEHAVFSGTLSPYEVKVWEIG